MQALTLDDLDLPNRCITIAGHPQQLGDLSHQALRAWLDYRRATWPHSPNRHVLISKRTALGDAPVSRGYVNFHLGPHCVSDLLAEPLGPEEGAPHDDPGERE